MSTQVLEEPSPICWTTPSPKWVKANWDAALLHQRNRMGLAVVVRDHMGKMVVAGCKTQKGCPDSSTAEALAVLMAIKICKEMGFS